ITNLTDRNGSTRKIAMCSRITLLCKFYLMPTTTSLQLTPCLHHIPTPTTIKMTSNPISNFVVAMAPKNVAGNKSDIA
ncbi:hypothetical protein CR513_41442, partial [Mucuna pruriens]